MHKRVSVLFAIAFSRDSLPSMPKNNTNQAEKNLRSHIFVRNWETKVLDTECFFIVNKF